MRISVGDGTHAFTGGPINVLYLDASVENQQPNTDWRGSYSGKVNDQWPVWYLPQIRFSNFSP
jgi:hypothetical protein